MAFRPKDLWWSKVPTSSIEAESRKDQESLGISTVLGGRDFSFVQNLTNEDTNLDLHV